MFILTGTSFGPTKMVYNGSGMEYTDRDSNLLPFTDYQYSVTVLNHVGKVSSLWELVTTKESPPDSVPAPAIEVSTQRHKPATFPINCEPVHEKTNNLGFRPGPTQTRLYSHIR